jgi:hypothetical protein
VKRQALHLLCVLGLGLLLGALLYGAWLLLGML